MKKDNTKKLSFWDQSCVKEWKRTVYPWKPSSEELGDINKILGTIGISSRVALLGSTPEIRKLIAQKKIKLDVIDFSEKMYEEMNKICKTMKNENFIKSDWIKYFSEERNKYDLIIGDLIERLLAKNEVILLSKVLKGALKRDGKILLRGDYYNGKESRKKIDIDSEINKLKNLKLSEDQIVDWLFFYLDISFKDREDLVLLKKIRNYLKINLDNKTIDNAKIIEKFILKWTYSPLDFYCRERKDIESVWERNFNVDAKIERQLFEGRLMALRLWKRKV